MRRELARLPVMTILILSLAVALIALFTVYAGVLVVRGPSQIRDLERRNT